MYNKWKQVLPRYEWCKQKPQRSWYSKIQATFKYMKKWQKGRCLLINIHQNSIIEVSQSIPITQSRTPFENYNYLSCKNSVLFGYKVRQLLVRSLYKLGSVSSTSTQQGFHDLGFGRERPPREGSEKAAARISPTWFLSRDASSLTFGF